MHLLIDGRTIQDHFPGIGRYVYNFVDALAPQFDGEVTVLVNPAQVNTRFDLQQLLRHANLSIKTTTIPTFDWREQIHLPDIIQDLEADIVHLPYYVRPYRLHPPTLLTLYDIIPHLFPGYFPAHRRLLIKTLKRLAVRFSDGFVAISHSTALDFGRVYGIPAAQIQPTPLAADPIFAPQPQDKVTALRSRMHLPDRYVLYLGSNKPHKNLVGLVQAWSQIASDVAPFSLCIAGSWDKRYPESRQIAHTVDLSNSIRFLGPVSNQDLPVLYAGAELFIFPSLYEGFGLPILEATACGTPTICSAIPSALEIVGADTLTFDPDQTEDIARVLLEVLTDDTLRQRLRQNTTKITSRFSWTKTAHLTLQAYNQLLETT